MSSGFDKLEGLKSLYPAVELWEEGGLPFVFFPELTVESAGKKTVMKALLQCHRSSEGYLTRLYLERQVETGTAKNWQVPRMACGQNWATWSWNGIPDTLPWSEILANHLKGLQ